MAMKNGNHVMVAINTANWFSKRSYKSNCNDHNDIEKCTATNRIGIILQFYDRSLHEINIEMKHDDNSKTSHTSMYNLLYDLLPNYSTVKLVNDYHHILFNHTQSSLQFESFYKYLRDNYISNQCNIKSCKSFYRNYRNRYIHCNKENKNDRYILYNNSDDCQEIYVIKLLDRIHCFILHSIDCGYKLTHKQLIQIEQNIKSNHNTDENHEITDSKIKSILKTLTTSHNNMYNINEINNNITLNIDRFTTNIGYDESNGKKDNLIEKKYSFGYAYKYWKESYSLNKWYIHRKFRNLKTEITSNDILLLNINQFNEEIKNAIDIINSKYFKKITCKYLKESNDPKLNSIGINEGTNMSIDHMLSLLFYSNYKHLQIALKNTYMKMNKNENDLNLINRHSNFSNLGQLLYESIHLFGNDISNQKQQIFYHFINKPIIFQHSFSYFYCPISTCNNLETIINIYVYNNEFNDNINETENILLELDRPHDGIAYYNYFNCGPLSDFTNQYELIFLGCLLKIKSIINVKLSLNYEFYLNVFDTLTQMFMGNVLYEPLEMNKIFVTNTLKHMLLLNKNDEEKNDVYIVELFKHFASRTQNIHINLYLFNLNSYDELEKKTQTQENIWLYDKYNDDSKENLYGYKIFKPFFISNNNQWIYVDKICDIFKNCDTLYIYNGDFSANLIKSIKINAMFMDRLIKCLSNNTNQSNLRNIYIYLPNYNGKDLKEIIKDFKYRLVQIKWDISIEQQTISDYIDTFSAVDTLCIRQNSFL